MSAARARIEFRSFGAVVVFRRRVVFKSTATDARFECARFIETWEPSIEAADIQPVQTQCLAEIVQW